MLIFNEPVTIIAPSDFKIKLEHVRDAEDLVDIPLDSTAVIFIFFDSYGNTYRCVHNPFSESGNVNCITDLAENTLTLVFKDYKLRDGLSVKMGTSIEDTEFDNGMWNSYDGSSRIPVKILWK
jgi:hypothetical protein